MAKTVSVLVVCVFLVVISQRGTALPQLDMKFPNNNGAQNGRVCVRIDSPGAGRYNEGFPRGPEIVCAPGYIGGIEYSG